MTNSRETICLYILNHNYGQFLNTCVESVMQQTRLPDEIFLIDDGSNDGSKEIIEDLKSCFPTINVVFQENVGLIASIRKIISISDADYFIRVDADDWISPDLTEELIKAFEDNPKVGLTYPDYYEVSEQGRKLRRVHRHDVSKDVTLLDMPAHGACTMVRRSAIVANEDLFSDIECQDGVDVWLSVIKTFEVRNVNLPLFFYRQHGSSLSKNENRLLENRRKIYARHARDATSKNLICDLVVPVSRRDEAAIMSFNLTDEGSNYLANFVLAAKDNQVFSNIVICYEEGVDINSMFGSLPKLAQIRFVERPTYLAEQGVSLLQTVQFLVDEKVLHTNLPISVQTAGYPMMKPAYHEMALYSQSIYQTDIVDSVRLDQSIFYTHNGKTMESLVPGEYRYERNLIFKRVGGLRFFSRNFISNGNCELSDGTIIGHIEVDGTSAISWEDIEFIRRSGILEI